MRREPRASVCHEERRICGVHRWLTQSPAPLPLGWRSACETGYIQCLPRVVCAHRRIGARRERGRTECSNGSEDAVTRRLGWSQSLFVLMVVVASWAWSFGSAPHALAQKVVLGPASADTGGAPVASLAGSALAEALRLQGLTVIRFEDAKSALPAGEGCDEACGARLLKAVSADFSAIVRVVTAPSTYQSRVVVRLFDSASHRYAGEADVRDGDVRDATTRAVLEARSYQLLGPGPWLRLEGTPEGAEVLLDGSVVGRLPYRAPIAPGSHDLVVRETGYTRMREAVSVPNDDGRRVDINVALEPQAMETPATAVAALPTAANTGESSDEDRTWLAAPVAMGAVGVGLAAALTVRLASGVNNCVDEDEEHLCVAKRGVRVGPTVVGYALSGVLLGGAITWIALGLSHESGPDQAEHARLSLGVGPGQLTMSGSF
jgi:hypothetical protein